MLVFGVDVPLVEVIFVLVVVIFFLLIESIVMIALLVKQMNKTKKLAELIEKLSNIMLDIKKAEISELDKIRRR